MMNFYYNGQVYQLSKCRILITMCNLLSDFMKSYDTDHIMILWLLWYYLMLLICVFYIFLQPVILRKQYVCVCLPLENSIWPFFSRNSFIISFLFHTYRLCKQRSKNLRWKMLDRETRQIRKVFNQSSKYFISKVLIFNHWLGSEQRLRFHKIWLI